MSEAREQLINTADRLFASLADEPLALAAVAEAGFLDLLTPETLGGFGGDYGDLFGLLRLAGAVTLRAPLADAILARRLEIHVGWSPADGFSTLAPIAAGGLFEGRFTGQLSGIAWGRDATMVLAEVDGRLVRLLRADAAVTHGQNAAGEPRDGLAFRDAVVESTDLPAIGPKAMGAFARTCQIAGALDAALMLSIDYANTRRQFGRPIGQFQAVQQSLAAFAVEAAAVNCAAQAAARAIDHGDAGFETAAAKLRANLAAGVGTAAAHQVHGAIGFTQAYGLHPLTRRLSAWRSEFGSDRVWAETLGAFAVSLGPEGLWPEITRRGDAA